MFTLLIFTDINSISYTVDGTIEKESFLMLFWSWQAKHLGCTTL